MPCANIASLATLPDVQSAYLALVPRIETHARIVFRGIACPDRRRDKIAESVALGWKWFRRLAERGKDASAFPVAFVTFVCRAVKCGRRLCGQEKAKDVLSPVAQARHGFVVERLPISTRRCFQDVYGNVNGQREMDVFEERLIDNTRTPPDLQVQFRLDFRAWLASMTARERRIIRAMAMNERTKDLSRRFELSPGRISQMRRQFAGNWQHFCDGPAETSVSHAVIHS